jgi:hypothetical protein
MRGQQGARLPPAALVPNRGTVVAGLRRSRVPQVASIDHLVLLLAVRGSGTKSAGMATLRQSIRCDLGYLKKIPRPCASLRADRQAAGYG